MRLALASKLLIGALLTFVPSGAAHAQLTGDALDSGTYEDDVWGFAVSWDPDVYDAELAFAESGEPYGVALSTVDVVGSVTAGGYADPAECLDDRVARLKAVDGVSEFKKARGVDLPQFDRDITGGAYSYEWPIDEVGNTDTYITYYGCEPLMVDGEALQDVVLTFEFAMLADGFAEFVPEMELIVNGISFRGDSRSSGDDDEIEGEGIDGSRYTDPTYGYAFDVPPDFELDTSEAVAGEFDVALTNDDPAVIGYVRAIETRSARTCVNDQVDTVEGARGVLSVTDADDLESIASDGADRSNVLRVETADASDNETITIYYIECREMVVDGQPVNGVFLCVMVTVPEDDWVHAVPEVEGILATVAFDDSRRSTDPGAGDSFTDPVNGWTVHWESPNFTGEEWVSEDSGDFLGYQLFSESGAFMTVYSGEARSLRSCVAEQADIVAGGSFSEFTETDDADLLTTSDEARGALFTGTFTASNGTELDLYLYAECRPLIVDGQEVDGTFLIVHLLSPVDLYADEADDWSIVLTSFEFSD